MKGQIVFSNFKMKYYFQVCAETGLMMDKLLDSVVSYLYY